MSIRLRHRGSAARHRTVGGGGPWSPSDLGTLSSWYDPSDNANRTIVSLLYQGLTNKQGTASRNLTQGTAGNCPSIGTINSLDALSFDGNSDWMAHSAPNLFAAGSCTVALVARAALQNDKHVVNESGVGTTNIYTPIYTPFSGTSAPPTSYIQVHGGSVQFGGANDGTGVWLENVLDNHVCIVTDSGSSLVHYVDGFTSSTKSYTRSALVDLAHFEIGVLRFVSGTFGYFNGLIGEIVCCTSVLGTSDRQKLEGYLAHKWGAADELDAGHPYKSAAP